MDLPRQLGPYRLTRRLGYGGMAQVFLAHAYGASGFEKQVALKTLLPAMQGEGRFERTLIDEARLGASLRHRNLVQVLDLGVEDGTYYVAMEHLDGGDLASALTTRTLPVPLALLIAEEIALGLDYVHRATDATGRPLGLVHRDVTPSNVLLSRAGEVKLADLGIAKATMLAEVTQGQVRKGKYAYMSPEQVTGVALTPASDQFSFGVTLFELLCGRRPFDAGGPLDTMDRVREAAPPDVTALDEDLGAIVLRVLARDPTARFADVRALHEALVAARRARPTVAPYDLAAWLGGGPPVAAEGTGPRTETAR